MRKTCAAVLAFALTFSAAGSALADGRGDPRIFPPSSHPRGQSYPEWEGAFQTWLNEIPAPENPFLDPASGRNCEVHGPVVFLGPFGADCRVPEGKVLVLPGAFWECSTAEGLGETFRELRRCAIENFERDLGRDVLSFTLRIDGRRVPQPRRWTFVTPGEMIVFPDDNIWGAPGGPTKSVTKGLLYLLRPFDEGRHRISFHVVIKGIVTFDLIWKLRVVD